MKTRGISKVDYAIMHGAFTFQIPEFIKTHKHNPDNYLNIVKHLIFVGHIHQYSNYKRIFAQGSFDRLIHGEEEPKGHIRAIINTDTNDYKVKFIENKGAKVFKTIDCTNLNLEDTILLIDKQLKKHKLPNSSYVRILVDLENPIISNMNMLVNRYPLLIWSKLVKDTDDKDNIVEDNSNEIFEYKAITISIDNIKPLLLERITEYSHQDIIVIADEILTSVM